MRVLPKGFVEGKTASQQNTGKGENDLLETGGMLQPALVPIFCNWPKEGFDGGENVRRECEPGFAC